MDDLSRIAHRQIRIARLLKYLDEEKKKLRSELFDIADTDIEGKSWMLPTTSIAVPEVFFERTGMDIAEFTKSRFPSWNVTGTSKTEDGKIVFVLRKKPGYISFSQQVDGLEISRSVSELTPEIDWDTMKKEDPDLFKAIAKPVTSYELNVDVLQNIMASDHFDAQGFLARHTKHKTPTLRVLAKEMKSESE